MPQIAASESTQQHPAADRALTTERVLTVPPAQVFTAFVSAERLARWWGPNGFRNTFQVFEPRPGGAWRFVMHGPNGAGHPNEAIFETLLPAERIVIRHVSRPCFTLTVTFVPEGSGTRLAWRQAFDSVQECEAVRRFAIRANEENLDRLEAELARESS